MKDDATSGSKSTPAGRLDAPPQVFISHASADRKKGEEICRLLERKGIRCWIAPRDIQAGLDYSEQIIDGIESTKALVWLLSESANRSMFVKNEVERAFSKGKTIITFRLEDVLPARWIEFFVSQTQWIDAFTPPFDAHVGVLAAAVRKIPDPSPVQDDGSAIPLVVEASSTKPVVEPPKPDRKPQKPERQPRQQVLTPRVMKLGGAVLAVGIVIVAAGAFVIDLLRETSITAVSAGYSSTCALLSDGTVECWGKNLVDQDGGESSDFSSSTPVSVSSLRGTTAIAGSDSHTCALLSNGTVNCWGRNDQGQLGDETTTFRSTPVLVHDLDRVSAISGGVFHNCALLTDGTVTCWGSNGFGQLGYGGTSHSQEWPPESVSGVTNATAITSGDWHVCALLENGTVRCWGRNDVGQLGNGFTVDSSVPVSVYGLSRVTAISAGDWHTCALLEDGTVMCWGQNDVGQSGDGVPGNSFIPVSVYNLSDVIAISASGAHTCALRQDGTAACWGNGEHGQLGNGFPGNSSRPVSVAGLKDAVSISAGDSHTCALLTDETVKCWGSNESGQLGDGGTRDSSYPVTVLGLANAEDPPPV